MSLSNGHCEVYVERSTTYTLYIAEKSCVSASQGAHPYQPQHNHIVTKASLEEFLPMW